VERDIIAHLIEFHGYRRLAFIQGPAGHCYAQERYHAYTDALEAYDIPFDPRLVTTPDDYVVSTGVKGVQLLLDERNLRPGVDFEVIVTASDLFALGAMDELRKRDTRVPEDVALVGFNDRIEGRFRSLGDRYRCSLGFRRYSGHFDRCEDDIGGVGWNGDDSRRSLSARRCV